MYSYINKEGMSFNVWCPVDSLVWFMVYGLWFFNKRNKRNGQVVRFKVIVARLKSLTRVC